ncbi:hypothetical protein ACIQ7D_02700 [Streptomyces sp. NPDC096310]|uniref:hypothetical protein n=1 Tax=Streptomyces sp. NPDC096310 TaxID=3366082 RepID=UPI003828254F
MTAGRCGRTIRAAVFAAVCVLLAVLGHVLMSGSTVHWWTMCAGFAATSGAGWTLAGRERGLPLVVSVVVVAQGVLHLAFSWDQSAAPVSGTGSVAQDMRGMSMGSMPMDPMDMSSTGSMCIGDAPHAEHLGHLAHGTGGMSPLGMLGAHTLAALLTGLWLAYGERAAFRLLRAVAGWLAAPLRLPLAVLPVPPRRPSLRPKRACVERIPRLTLTYTIISRGPPAGIAVI